MARRSTSARQSKVVLVSSTATLISFWSDPIDLSFFYVKSGHHYHRGGLFQTQGEAFREALRVRPLNLSPPTTHMIELLGHSQLV